MVMLTCRDQQAAAYKGSRKINRLATHPIHFAADSPDKIIAALRGRYFSFSQIKSYVVVQSSKICFLVVDYTTAKCYSCA